ncbi:MAG: hypothetical protein KDK10_12235 [Maritimibacter sp.]|nr:hypothetical protein [Maritimibacter sp.]
MTKITDSTPILDKVRAGRRAALASLHTRLGHSDKIVSIFENTFPPRQAVAEFHSVRSHTAARRQPVLVLTNPLAA